MPTKPTRQGVGRLRQGVAVTLVFALVAATVGCKTFSDHTRATRTALDLGDLGAALKASNRALDVRGADSLPEPLRKNDALLLLDRAMVLQARRDYPRSARDFQVADKTIEMLDFTRSSADEIVRYMFTDSAGPYKARPYEKLLINTLNMLNYLGQENLEGARVEARRFSVMRDYLLGADKVDVEAVRRAGAAGSYFAGYAFEKSREPDAALRYYDEVLQAINAATLVDPIGRLKLLSGYRTPRLEAASEAASKEGRALSRTGQDASEILIVVNYGRVPPLVAKRVPIGLALTFAAAFLSAAAVQQANRLAAQGLVTWVNYPELASTRSEYPVPRVAINGRSHAVEVIANVDEVVRQAWEESKGRVMAAAVTRMLTRAAIGAGAGVAVGRASNRSGLGVFASMVTQASMAAADKPDTRSWATLPARIAVVRAELSPGRHEVDVSVLGRQHRIEVDAGTAGWVLVDVTELATQ